jgi:hypothetical protein
MRTRRRENRRRFRGKGAPTQRGCERNGSAAQAPTFADVLKAPEQNAEVAPAAPRLIDQPLLKVWPRGYENGQFRLADGGVLLAAKGQPTLFVRENDAPHPAAEVAENRDAGPQNAQAR